MFLFILASTASAPIGILLPGTKLLDSPVRMEFSTGELKVPPGRVYLLSTEFSSAVEINKCDIIAAVTSLQQSWGHQPMAAIYFTIKLEFPTL